jgi:adenylate cyclase class 1
MAAPREASRIERASVIYSTNWGEMFCRIFQRPGPLFEATRPASWPRR